ATAATRNVISGNAFDGVTIIGSTTTNNLVQANYIGIDKTGASALANGGNGIALAHGANGNTVGGTTTGRRNLISGNAADGVAIHDNGTTGNTVEGNYIGTDPTGATAVANGSN